MASHLANGIVELHDKLPSVVLSPPPLPFLGAAGAELLDSVNEAAETAMARLPVKAAAANRDSAWDSGPRSWRAGSDA